MKNSNRWFGPGFSAFKMVQNSTCWADEGGEGGGGAAVVEPPEAAPQVDTQESNDPGIAPGDRSPLNSLADSFAKLNGKEAADDRPGSGRVSIPAKKQGDAPTEPIKPSGDAPAKPVAAPKPQTKPIEGLADPASLNLPGAKGKASENWNKIHGELTKSHDLIRARDTRITELETALATEKTKWEDERKKLSGEVETLRPFRAVTDEQNTPEFQAQYDKPVADAQKEMTAILKKAGIKEEEFTKFLPNVAAMQNIANQLSEAGYKLESRQLESRIEKMADLQLKRENAIEDFKANHSKIIETRKAEVTAKTVQATEKAKSHLEAQWSSKDDKGNMKYPFFNEVKTPPDATDEVKARDQEYNESVKSMREQMKKYLSIDTPEHKAELAMGTMLAAVFYHRSAAAEARVKSLEVELGKVAKAGGAPRSENPNRNSGPTIPRGTGLGEAFMQLNGR